MACKEVILSPLPVLYCLTRSEIQIFFWMFLPFIQNIINRNQSKLLKQTYIINFISNFQVSRYLLFILYFQMKERLSNLINRPFISYSGTKNNQKQLSNLFENARICQATTLEDISEEFPIFEGLLKEHLNYQVGKKQQKERKEEEVSKVQVKNQKNARKLEKIEKLKEVYINYSPIHEEEREIRLMIQSMEAVEDHPRKYIEAVFHEYKKRGGEKSITELQDKLEADMMFLIRRENQSQFRQSIKYH